MIITAKASTIRAAAKRAGELSNLTIRSGEAAKQAENTFVDSNECSVRIAVQSPGVESCLAGLVDRYGSRGPCDICGDADWEQEYKRKQLCRTCVQEMQDLECANRVEVI